MNNDKVNKLMKEYDKLKKPKHWRKFINNNTKEHNLILKYGNSAFCTHCQKYFYNDVKVHPYKKSKCPHCKKEYNVRNHNIRRFSFFKDVALYCKVDGKVIVKIFEIESFYDYKSRKFKKSIQEFARFVPEIGIVINNAVSFYMWSIKVYHNIKKIKWHIYTGSRRIYNLPIYPYNKKNLFKGTVYEYAPIKEFKEKYKYYDDFEILQIAGYRSFELLWKMGLHRLSLSAKYFNKKGNFEKRFGVPKSFLEFMVENDIDYNQYKILKLIQEPNMELIKRYSRYDYNYLAFIKKQGYLKDLKVIDQFEYFEDTIRKICKYVPLRKLLNYPKGLKNISIYKDYLEMLNKLNYNMKCRNELFPKQLIARHDKLVKQIKIIDDIETQSGVYSRFLELSRYIYKDEKYIIFPGPSVDDIKDEGEQQGNCVAREYMIPYKNRKTEIYFIRKLDDVTKSFITLEYRNGVIVQKELPKHSRDFSKEQLDFINKWVGFRKFMEIKEKYETKIVKYDLKKLVA